MPGVFVTGPELAREMVCDMMRLERSQGQITQGLMKITKEVIVSHE